MSKKILSTIFIIALFITSSLLFIDYNKSFKITKVNTPTSFNLNKKVFNINEFETFDPYFSDNNKTLAKNLNLSETEAFILGNLGKYWAKNLMEGRYAKIKENSDLIYSKYSYKAKFYHSGYCFKDSKPCSEESFHKKLKEIRRTKYMIFDYETGKSYKINDKEVQNLQNFILIKKTHLNKILRDSFSKLILNDGTIKVFFTDSTFKLKPDRNCSTDMCKEILFNIDNAQKTIDIAIYGYSKVPTIEEAIKKAINRGVKVRLVYDKDSKGKNIYPDTQKLVELIKISNNDGKSKENKNIMHNKFYIFDNKILITGSANLSHTDMSGYNSNSIIVVNSPELASIYRKEFEQMLNGKFHNDKTSFHKKSINVSGNNIIAYFSPQDKSITNAIIPIIKNAKEYIYIPTFVLTEQRVTDELIKAKRRGVDVKIIIDALNASIRHSKHSELRQGGLEVKTENYAGKMHSKSMIVDDKITIIGSMNFSNSGENKNDENIIVIKNNDITKFYKNFFLHQWSQIDNKWLSLNVRAEGKDSIGSCSDGIDNNYDGLTDLEDIACK